MGRIPEFSLFDIGKWNLLHDKDLGKYNISIVAPGCKLQHFPHRVTFYGIGICTAGSVVLDVNLKKFLIKKNSLIILGPEVIRRWADQSDDYYNNALFFTNSFILQHSEKASNLLSYPFFKQDATSVIPLNEIEAENIWRLLQDVKRAIDSDSNRKDQIISHYTSILLTLTSDYYDIHAKPSESLLPSNELIDRFKALLSVHYRETRKVNDYADMLCISAKHLSQTIKLTTGKTAGEWIDDITVLEAKVLLKQSSLTVSQISSYMGFGNISTFGKFFKKNVGFTPIEYRSI
nr:AraC family transcriptional regulator [Pedobacter panaciterrae]